MATRILVVCPGNIRRTPAAEGVFRALAPEAVTDSCGTRGRHPGAPPHGWVQAAARAPKTSAGGGRLRGRRGADGAGQPET